MSWSAWMQHENKQARVIIGWSQSTAGGRMDSVSEPKSNALRISTSTSPHTPTRLPDLRYVRAMDADNGPRVKAHYRRNYARGGRRHARSTQIRNT
ncbi:hypothetical protein EVAR_46113_1 [Eumeta japonica]|uniref:Uncharacterized protein n=1 Tax=Eumeta variegata TaxID=151549 RepID=A0A4C1XTS0_EUMVA|nr:hypothetical protein EVAR_46113_1 [Eumeta japonica]